MSKFQHASQTGRQEWFKCFQLRFPLYFVSEYDGIDLTRRVAIEKITTILGNIILASNLHNDTWSNDPLHARSGSLLFQGLCPTGTNNKYETVCGSIHRSQKFALVRGWVISRQWDTI